MRRSIAFLTVAFALVQTAAAGEKAVSPFNGKDLTGWKLKGDPKRSQWQVGSRK